MLGRTAFVAAAAIAALSPLARADTIRVVTLTTNRIAYNPVDGMIYATVPSSAGAPAGNSITPIDAASGIVGTSVFMGSEPGPLAVSDSGRFIYVGFTGVNAVRPFDVMTQTAGTQFSLGAGFFVEDIEVQPGNELVVAVSRRNQCCSPRHEGVAIFDNGVQRPTTTPGHTGSNVIAWSGAPGELLGYNNETTEYGLRRMAVSASGVTVTQTNGGLISGFGVDIKQAGGFIYTTSGRKIDAAAFTLAGAYPTTGLVEPDPANGRVYFLATSGSPRVLRVFDITTFLEIGSINIPQVSSSAGVSDLVRWGTDGLAFRTTTGQVVLVNTDLTNPSAVGACCRTDGTCSAVTYSGCTSAGGVWRGPGTSCVGGTCPQAGSCCLADGSCSVLIQASCGGVWTAGITCAQANCQPGPGPHYVRIVPIATNRIVYNPADQMVYASIPASSGAPNGNSIVRISTATAAVSPGVFMGSDPTQVAVSDTGRYVYAGLNGIGSVRRLDTTTQTAGLQFSLGFGSLSAHYVDDLEVQPGNENVIAVSRRNQGFSPRHEGVAIFDNGVQRPTVTPGHTGSDVIAWSDTPGILYGYNNETTEFGLRRMTVDSSGVTTTQTVGNLISGFGTDIKHAAGFIYSTTGRKIDAAAFSLAGTYPMSGLIEPDPARGRVYILASSGSPRVLKAYDINTFLETGSMNIAGITSGAAVTDLYRWGNDGLVFRTPTQVVLIRTTLVPAGACYANCDGSTGNPVLNVNDFVCFQGRFAAGEPYADCDHSSTLNVNDFVCFQSAFAAGCR